MTDLCDVLCVLMVRVCSLEKDRLIVKKVEPWNSVKVTLNIPKDAAEKLKALASHNNGSELLSMGIMSLQMEGRDFVPGCVFALRTL